MVKTMSAAASVPHFHYHDDVCVDALIATRAALAGHSALHGAKLTLLPFIIKVGVCGGCRCMRWCGGLRWWMGAAD